MQVIGTRAAKKAPISWRGAEVTTPTAGGTFIVRNGAVPPTCVGELSDGVDTAYIPVQNCVPTVVPSEFSSPVLATGQTTAYQAFKNDGDTIFDDVPDDGTLQLGLPLQYVDNGDGTVTDLNTGPMWEKKTGSLGAPVDCSPGCGDLHIINQYHCPAMEIR